MSGSEPTLIRHAMEEVRKTTLHLFTDIDETDFRRQVHSEFSPVGWHLGHIGVTEAYWVLQQCKGEPSPSPAYDHFFTPTENPKPNRVSLPAREDLLAYLHGVRERVLVFLEHLDFCCDHPLLKEARIFWMLLQHEEQHIETMLLILHLLTASRYATAQGGGWGVWFRPPPRSRDALRGEKACATRDRMVFVPAGCFALGSAEVARSLDNERPQHLAAIGAFWIDRDPVSNAEFLQFIEQGGYHERSWWSPEGWRWREQHAIEHPLYWRVQPGGAWHVVSLTGLSALEPAHPVMGVSWYEADAYARSVGKRLPTEAEWEKAACWDPLRRRKLRYPWGDSAPDAARCNMSASNMGTTAIGQYPGGNSPWDCRDMLGNVWEWTATWFHPYPGFRAYPYEGYSVPYFDQHHRVLKGGSWATHRHVVRPTFRNWYLPWIRAIFAGFRCARDV